MILSARNPIPYFKRRIPTVYSIKKLLIITVSSMLVVLTVALTFACDLFFKNTMLQVLSEDHQNSLSLISQKTDSMINSANAISNLLCRDDIIVGALLSDEISLLNVPTIKAQIDQTYTKYYESFKQIDMYFQIMCMGKNGFLYSSKPDHTLYDFKKMQSYSWFTKAIANKTESYINTSFNDYNDKSKQNSYAIAVVRNIFTQNGDYAGSIIVCVPESIISNTYTNLVNNSNRIYVLDDLSVAISCNDKSKLGTVPFQLTDYRFVRGYNNYSIYESNNQKFFSAKYRSAATGWTVFEQIPLDDVLSPIKKFMWGTIYIAILGCFISIIISTFLAKKVSNPLQAFCDKMESITSNDFQAIDMKSNLIEINTISLQFNQLTDQVKNLMEDIKQNEQEINTAKFNFLKAQINPHFLYNTLFAIKCTVSMGKAEQACKMITILISLLRYSISSNDSKNTLLDESMYLSQYIKLQNLRCDDKITFKFNLPDSLMNVSILRFILQPIVENAIIHGMPANADKGLIVINFIDAGSDIVVEVCDNGKEFTQAELEVLLNDSNSKNNRESSSHIGLTNIQRRIQLNYGSDYHLFIGKDELYNTAVCVRLPKSF